MIIEQVILRNLDFSNKGSELPSLFCFNFTVPPVLSPTKLRFEQYLKRQNSETYQFPLNLFLLHQITWFYLIVQLLYLG